MNKNQLVEKISDACTSRFEELGMPIVGILPTIQNRIDFFAKRDPELSDWDQTACTVGTGLADVAFGLLEKECHNVNRLWDDNLILALAMETLKNTTNSQPDKINLCVERLVEHALWFWKNPNLG